MTISAGTKLGRYEIRSKLGEAGMGEVSRKIVFATQNSLLRFATR